jgi:hypothetical protein
MIYLMILIDAQAQARCLRLPLLPVGRWYTMHMIIGTWTT